MQSVLIESKNINMDNDELQAMMDEKLIEIGLYSPTQVVIGLGFERVVRTRSIYMHLSYRSTSTYISP